MKRCVILQPSYIPWRGFFHQIQKCDVFVFYDDVQYDKRGWRNRNQAKTAHGLRWLTIPVHASGSQSQHRRICDIEIDYSTDWRTQHWRTIQRAYSKAPFFPQYAQDIESLYQSDPRRLADFTIDSTIQIAKWLGITATEFIRSSSLPAEGAKTDRLISILKHLGADHYISGPSAKSYLEADKFEDAKITFEFIQYDYPEYPQLHGGFEPQVTVLDLLLNTGSEAGRFIWG